MPDMTKKYRLATPAETRTAAAALDDDGDLTVLNRVVTALFGDGVRGGFVRFEKGFNIKLNAESDVCLLSVSAFNAQGDELKPVRMRDFLNCRDSLPAAQAESLDVLMSVTKGWDSTRMALELLNEHFRGEFPPKDDGGYEVLIYRIGETPYISNTPLLYVEAD